MRWLIFILFPFLLAYSLKAKSFFVRLSPQGQKALIESALFKTDHIPYQKLNNFPQDFPPLQKWFVVQADSQQLLTYQKQQFVESFEPINRFKIFELSNDSLVSQQWYLQKIDVEQAWQVSQGKAEIILAIIDTGIDYTHPDLAPSLWINESEKNGLVGVDDDQNGLIDDVQGWDFTDAPDFPDGGDYLNPDPDPMDEFLGGHGTEIAGIIGAQVNNRIGIAGIAPRIKIMNLRAGTAAGYLEEDDVIRAMLYAYQMGATIINMSFGDRKISTVFKDVVHYLWQKGITMVAAAGNEGQPQVYYPAALKETIAVGSSEQNDQLSAFSNFGYGLDLVAPGVNIMSTAPHNSYRSVSGTSFSAPMVAAVCALVSSTHSGIKNESVRAILKNTTDWHSPNLAFHLGAGRLNAGNALHAQNEGKIQLEYSQLKKGNNYFALIGSAYHPDLQHVILEYGVGANPEHWVVLKRWSYHYFYDDTLTFFDAAHFADTLLTFKLTMQLLNRSTIETICPVRIDHTKPNILNFRFDHAYQKSENVGLVHLLTDDPVSLKLYVMKAKNNQMVDSLWVHDIYREHFVTLPADFLKDGDYIKLIAENQNNEQTQKIVPIPEDFSQPYFWQPWISLDFENTISAGYLLNKMVDLNQNKKAELVLSFYLSNGGVGNLGVFELSNNHFTPIAQYQQSVIPRDAVDMDGDGIAELLVSFGNRSQLLKYDPIQKIFSIVWQDSNFWAGNLADCNLNGQYEILGYRDSTYWVLEDQGNFHFVPISSLNNNSSGENRYGSPKVLVHDFDEDGSMELVFGDYDGDILIYTCQGSSQFKLKQILKTYQTDATNLLSAGDNNLFVLSHTDEGMKFESDLAQLYWTLEIFAFDQTQQKMTLKYRNNFYPYLPKKNFDAGLNYYHANGQQHLFLALYPSFYLMKKIDNQWQLVWQADHCQSNTVVVQKDAFSDKLRCFFNNGQKIIAYQEYPDLDVLVPYNLKAKPLDSSRVQIEWQGKLYKAFNLYRGTNPDQLNLITQVRQNKFVDRQLLANEPKYYYSVTAVTDSMESPFSNMDSVKISPSPKLIDIQRAAYDVFILSFDQQVFEQTVHPAQVFLKRNKLWAKSIFPLFQNKQLMAIFNLKKHLLAEDTLLVKNLTNKWQMPINPKHNWALVNFSAEIKAPRVTQFEVCSRTCLQIVFSQPMDSSSVLNLQNYVLYPWGNVASIQILDKWVSKTELVLTKESAGGGLGQAAYLQISGLRNRWQVPMDKAQKFSLFRPTDNLSQIIIYPQPIRPEDHQLIFAKLPPKTQIHIFNINGLLVRKFEKVNEYGGINWDLCDEQGKNIASGIYFYRITNGQEQKIGKLVIVR